MDILKVLFPVSGVETYIFIPPFVACIVSFFTSMGGVSGAFLLLPFQMSFLNFTSPSVSSTNFLFNIVAIPSGVYRYLREGRMAWPLTMIIAGGTLPGVGIGYYVRIFYLPEPGVFKLFAGCVLLTVGIRLFYEVVCPPAVSKKGVFLNVSGIPVPEEKIAQRSPEMKETRKRKISAGLPPEGVVRTVSVSMKKVEYEFLGEKFSFSSFAMVLLAFIVGIIGGAYGIGGGAIIAPFCVAVFRLPVYSVAGAALMGTFLTSIAGVLFYSVIPAKEGLHTSPDWLLGFLFGAGGLIGMYFGARFQKFVPQRCIKIFLSSFITFVAIKYILQYLV